MCNETKKYSEKLVFVSFIFLLQGCASQESLRRDFVSLRDFDIGRIVDVVPLAAPDRIEPTQGGLDRYHYEFVNEDYSDEKCEWIYVVDRQSREIISWEYVSDPGPCYAHGFARAPW